MRDLALLGCSKAKRLHTGPARLVYDGPAYRMLRPLPVDLLILSAKHGLLEGETWIEPYDERLGARCSPSFAAQARARLALHLRLRAYERVLVLLGKDYAAALGPLDAFDWGQARLTVTRGKIGQRLHGVARWRDEAYGR